jgi:phosphoribosylformylglycinamidine cyclo-ligase
VGVVELARAVNPTRVEAGDIVLGLGSNGIHSNGYSMVRRIVEECGLDLEKVYPELGEGTAEKMAEGATKSAEAAEKKAEGRGRPHGVRASANGRAGKGAPPVRTLGEVLLTPTRIYVRPIVRLLSAYRVKKVVGGMAHITGSGMVGNLERALHLGVDAVVERSAWPVPAVFRFLQKHGRVEEEEMRRVFNMGIGFCLIVRPSFAASIREQLQRSGERVYEIGKIVKGTGKVRERQ